MPIISLSVGKCFFCSPGATILEAASKAQIALPYSCKTGRCSTCKCKVIHGTTRLLQPEIGLSEKEKAEGWILSCVRAVESDVMLEMDNLCDVELPSPRTWPCRISEITLLAPDVVQILLRLPPTSNFSFLPGQYIEVIGPKGIRRSYSLARFNYADKILELHIRAVKGGAMSDYWFNLAKPNDLLRLNGPLGTFVLRETAGIDLIFLATGTGIAPVRAMLESIAYLSADHRPKTVTVLWGGRKLQDFYCNVTDIPGSYAYIPVHSCPSDEWSGSTGYIQDVLLNIKQDFINAAVYACGSEVMIQSARKLLLQAGLSAKNFYSDAFVNSGRN